MQRLQGKISRAQYDLLNSSAYNIKENKSYFSI